MHKCLCGESLHVRWRSTCWVYASDLKDKGIFEKYSWAVLKAWSETIAAGMCPRLHQLSRPDALRFAELGSLSLFFGLPTHARRTLLQHGTL